MGKDQGWNSPRTGKRDEWREREVGRRKKKGWGARGKREKEREN